MSGVVNTYVQPRASFNTGFGKDALNRSRPKAFLFIPQGYTFTSAQTATATAFLAALQALMVNADPTQRAYKLTFDSDFKQMTPDSQKVTLPFGGERYLAKGIPGFQVDFALGGLDNFQNVLDFDNAQSLFDLLIIDRQGVVYGTNKTYNSGNTFGGFQIGQIHIPTNEMQGANTYDVYRMFVYLSNAEQFNEGLDFIATGVVNLPDVLPPFEDVVLSCVTGPAANKISVKVWGGYSRVDLTPLYSTILNSTSLWTANKVSDGSAGTISAATYTSGTKTIDLTITSGTGLAYNIGMANATALIAAAFNTSTYNFEWNQNKFTVNTDNQATAG